MFDGCSNCHCEVIKCCDYLIVFDVDKHSSPSTSSKEPSISPTKPYKPPSRASTQNTDAKDSNPNPQPIVAEVPIRNQKSKISNFTAPSTKSAAKQKSLAGLSRRKRRCKIVHMEKKRKLKNFYFLLNC